MTAYVDKRYLISIFIFHVECTMFTREEKHYFLCNLIHDMHEQYVQQVNIKTLLYTLLEISHTQAKIPKFGSQICIFGLSAWFGNVTVRKIFAAYSLNLWMERHKACGCCTLHHHVQYRDNEERTGATRKCEHAYMHTQHLF